MRFKKIDLIGFKSFAERESLIFGPGITGIVGPNGCGKSNISDAVRWVLGEQSAKTLRGSKMEDVIFCGTAKRKPKSFCEVSLVFDNEDSALPIDFAEVMVTRRAYRNGESEYYINKSSCRLKDITALFRDTGIGKEGYSLIGQGRIDEILSPKSEDRRQVFEEAAGISAYKASKQEAERRISQTEQNLERVMDILTDMESRLGPLKERAETAKRYLTLKDESKILEINAFIIRHERLTERITNQRAIANGLNEVIQALKNDESAFSQKLESDAAVLADIDGKLTAERTTFNEKTQKHGEILAESRVLRERIENAQKETARIQSAIANFKENEESLKTRIAEIESKALKSREAELSEKAKQFANATAELQAEAENLEKTIEDEKNHVINTMNRLSDFKSSAARLEALSSQMENRLKEIQNERGESIKIHEGMNESLAQAEAECEKAKVDLSKIKMELDTTQAESDKKDREIEERNNAIAALQASSQQASSRLALLRELERDAYQQAVKRALERTEDFGIHGVIAKLIAVPERLERAIEMALGFSMQNIVIESEQHAKSAINFLRENRYGRATFLPLTTVTGRTLNAREREAAAHPGCIGPAMELIGYDEKYAGVIGSLLGRTVIAENLDAGIEVMRKTGQAIKVVTIAGDVMNPGGAISGGSMPVKSASLLSRAREITEHEAKLEKLSSDIEETRKTRDILAVERAELKSVRAELYTKLRDSEINSARAQERLYQAKQDISAIESQLSKLELEYDRLTSNRQDAERERSEMLSGHVNAEENMREKQRAITKLQIKLSEMRTKLDERRADETEQRVELAREERAVMELKREQTRCEDELIKLRRSVSQSAAELIRCRADAESHEKALREGESELASLESELSALRSGIEVKEAERLTLSEAQKELNKRQLEVRGQIDNETEKRHKAELILNRSESELTILQERIYEDFGLSYAGALEHRVKDFDMPGAEKRIEAIRKEIREIGEVSVTAVDEYRETSERHDELLAQHDDLIKAKTHLEDIISELVKRMEQRFREQFELLNANFKETFRELFGGGTAELRLDDERDVLGCGIEIIAQPVGKKLQLLSLLSGGERALTAIAILFAMLKLKPTPFCFLDEIEAALDEANIENFANYLRDFSNDTQFVVVTHRKGTMVRCDTLYGVAMEEKGISKMVSIKLD